MMIDDREMKILNQIIETPEVKSKSVEKNLGLSKDQLTYSLKKINAELISKGFRQVQRTRKGHFIIDEKLKKGLDTSGQLKKKIFYFSEEERQQVILLMLMATDDFFLLDYFSLVLHVSRNTIVRDIKKIRNQLKEPLLLESNRHLGYHLTGSEWEIRKLLGETMTHIKELANGNYLLATFGGLEEKDVLDMSKILHNVEQKMKIRFTDEQYNLLPYLVIVIKRRISNGHAINLPFDSKEADIRDTKEYEIAKTIIFDNEWVSDDEYLYMTLQLLSTHIFSGEVLTKRKSKQLELVIETCLDTFIQRALIDLSASDRDLLLSKLNYHLKPAYYRMKYDLNVESSVEEIIINKEDKVRILMKLVQESFGGFEDYLEKEMPEIEVFFISIIIGSVIYTSDSLTPKKYSAIVVCPRGVTYSQVMKNILTTLFPEFYFFESISYRDYQESNIQADVVFSIRPTDNSPNCFKVHPKMTEDEKQRLRKTVYNQVFGITDLGTLSTELLSSLDQYLDPRVERELILEKINDILTDNQHIHSKNMVNNNVTEQSFLELLAISRIQVVEKVTDYCEAIRLAGAPLVKEKLVSRSYVEACVTNHDYDDPYIVLGNQVAIPHSSPEDGVKELAISLLIIKEGVLFSKDEWIKVVFLIAPVDNVKHIDSLFQIVEIAENQAFVEKLIKGSTREEVKEIIERSL